MPEGMPISFLESEGIRDHNIKALKGGGLLIRGLHYLADCRGMIGLGFRDPNPTS